MLTENLGERHTRMEQELARLCYRRLLLTRELETNDKRIAELEGAIGENEAASRDAANEAAITKAKAESEANAQKELDNA